jgi:hypothetical protein
MKLIKLTTVGAVIAFLGLANVVQALPEIKGGIGFSGAFATDGSPTDLTTGTMFTIVGAVTTVPAAVPGDFAGAPASPDTFLSPILVHAGLGGNVGQNLYTITIGGNLFTFLINSISQDVNSAKFYDVSGTGTVTAAGFAPTIGTYTLNFTQSGGSSFTWGATSTAIPDGGTTVILLGAALSGLGLLRRKLAA